MKKNRRSYYRILHVQPEAPLEVIRASYRTLMGTLRHHPDLGGDHEVAALINEAYAVLSDPARRQAYDLTQFPARMRGPARAQPADAGPAPARREPDPARWAIDHCCPMCRAALPAAIRADTRCGRCLGPLADPPTPSARNRELFGRRDSPRRAKDDAAVVYPGWRAPAIGARLRDLSLTGISVHVGVAIPVDRAIRIVDPVIDAVAVVVSCRPAGKVYAIHARLLTAQFQQRSGVFVSATA